MSLKGYLHHMPLVDLLYILRQKAKSGILVLVNDAMRGAMYLQQGNLIDAWIIPRNQRSHMCVHETAVAEMLNWDDAVFVFQHDPTVDSQPVHIDSEKIEQMLALLRNQPRGAVRKAAHIITLDTQVQLPSKPVRTEIIRQLEEQHWRITGQFTAHQPALTVQALAQAAGVATETTLSLIIEMVAMGILEIVPPQPAPRAHAAGGIIVSSDISEQKGYAAVRYYRKTPPPEHDSLQAIMRCLHTL